MVYAHFFTRACTCIIWSVSVMHWMWLTFQDRCNEEFTNIDGIRRIPLSRQLSIRFSQQRKLTLSRNSTNRWRSATQKVRVRKACSALHFALCISAASRLVLLLDGFLSFFWHKSGVCMYKAWRRLQNFCSFAFCCYCRLTIVVANGIWDMCNVCIWQRLFLLFKLSSVLQFHSSLYYHDVTVVSLLLLYLFPNSEKSFFTFL